MKWIVILLLLNTVSALGVVHNQYNKRLAVIQMSHLEDKKNQLIGKWSQLLVEYAAWSANPRIERIAIQRLNMKHHFRSYGLTI